MKSLMPFITIALCVTIYFLYISPTLGDIDERRGKLAEYRNALEQTKELKIQRDAAITASNNISEADLNRLNKIIPGKFDGVLFVNDISAMAARNGVKMSNFKTSETAPATRNVDEIAEEKPFKVVSVSFKLTGQYDQFIKFLKELESSLQLIDVISLNITSGKVEKASDNNLDYDIEINTYSLK
jgi:Tfp pilus assembly protein PilO